jgi:hypothetical protein
MTVYMQGTRRIDEIAADARRLAYQENYSYTEGWDDNTVASIFNLALNKIYDRITEIDQVGNIQEYTQTVFSGQAEYDIPQDVKMKLQIINVRFLYGPADWQFVTLVQSMIQDRFGYSTNIPSTYCIRNGKLILSPRPNITRPDSLIVNYQKRMRSLDFRRGKVSGIEGTTDGALSTISNGTVTTISNANPAQVTTLVPHNLTTGDKVGLTGIFEPSPLDQGTYIVTVTGANTFTLNGIDTTNANVFSGTCLWFKNPVVFVLNFTSTSQKDVNMKANADSILDKVDWVSFVDENGSDVIDAIRIQGYNQGFAAIPPKITCAPNYVIPYTSWLKFQALLTNQDTFYVIQGDYASTHSQLDRQAEDLFLEYVVLRLLRLQSAAEPTEDQREAEEAVLSRLAIAYRRYRPSILPIIWQRRNMGSQSNTGGRGAY